MLIEEFVLQERPSADALTVLEIGSGFSQLADAVLQDMASNKQALQYTFSSHSPMLIGRAKKALQKSPPARFSFLDIQQDVLAQVRAQGLTERTA